MQMKIPQSKEQWDGWILGNTAHHQFPQSWEWGEILRSEGRAIERYIFEKDGVINALAQEIVVPLPFGGVYGFVPKGPVLAKNYTGGILDNFRNFFIERKVVFTRVEPSYPLLPISNFTPVPTIDINPRATVILDLTKDEAHLQNEMHQKTRYNIHLAQKKNLIVKTEKNLAVFLKLMKQTAKRDGFRLHTDKHYRAIFDSEMSRQITIYHENAPVASGVFIQFGDTFTYLYGASDHEYRALMAPYLVQWEGIKMGKSLGCKYYDFFGIAPGQRNRGGEYIYDPHHQYAGVTRFKFGFGGEVSTAPGTIDLVVDMPKYCLYKILRWVRRLL